VTGVRPPGWGFMKRVARTVAKFATALIGSAVLARAALPALGAVLLVVLIVAAVLCWILASSERSDRTARLIGAARGQAPALSTVPPVRRRATAAGWWRRTSRRDGTGHG
jgi:hypothetical protein